MWGLGAGSAIRQRAAAQAFAAGPALGCIGGMQDK